ncbi:small ribosomal subunit protein mS23-like [Montipora foliosa]|uniref:small ribosomal subunit protein mS23-like n=1 Tax=Montipora foliosa TaxID=591990 RepID=UPI0035F1D58B
MPGARHLRGTVASRVRNLLRAGAITKAWEPVWFPVVEAFPPLTDTKVNRRAEAGRMLKITYPEDKIRNQFYERFETKQPLYLWGDNDPSHCDRFVETCLQLAKEGLNDEEAIEKATNTLEFHKMTRGVHLDQEPLGSVNGTLDTKDQEEDLLDSEYPELPNFYN